MRELQLEGIGNYFFLHERIENNYRELEDLRYRHENRNYYTRTAFHELGFSTQGFKMEREVNDFVEAERSMLNRIERLNKRKKRFERMIERLEPIEQNYLKAKYEQGKHVQEQPRIEQKALSIVEEMEEYKLSLTPYKVKRMKRAACMKQQQEDKKKEEKENSNKYDQWLNEIIQNEELAKSLDDKGYLTRLINLQDTQTYKDDLQAISNP